ncbi:HK97 family phage major capsid protein [Erythromicrobium ramosum]|uniref:HK97 family phage major capsid protein n=2 Tax=Erythrobacter ramosus TaxID=35811 RepID=A0ABR6HW18_9SPHN|nr:phage major capsid protein [Erythrobacter ramosus]MBB3774844.1 HK97 family phage major capsid protein [Erythrobacter ramosus]
MDNTPTPMTATDPLDASFDLLARQDQAEADITALRGDVDEVKSRLDKVARAASRPAMGGAAPASDATEVKSFVDGYLRRGRETELKSISGVAPADGGFAVPRQIDALIADVLTSISPIRAIAQVVQTGTAGYRKLVTTSGTASGWVSEVAMRPETATPKFAEIAPPMGDLYANPAASQAMLDDAGFDIETWLASEIAVEFARAEGSAFVKGTGTNQPEGFLTAAKATTPDATRAFGTLQYAGSGNATGLGTAPDTKLIDLVHMLKAGYRQGAVFVMNSATLAAIRKLKTVDGALLWQPGLVEGQPDRLLGYPVVEAEDMPDVAAGTFPIAFGNFRSGYLISERGATQVLRDPFTNKPFVHFYATKRIGGKVLDSNAIKLLKIEL